MARPPSLHMSKALSPPAEAVTQTFALLAKRGAGKTYTAAVMVEELCDSVLPERSPRQALMILTNPAGGSPSLNEPRMHSPSSSAWRY